MRNAIRFRLASNIKNTRPSGKISANIGMKNIGRYFASVFTNADLPYLSSDALIENRIDECTEHRELMNSNSFWKAISLD